MGITSHILLKKKKQTKRQKQRKNFRL